MVAASGPGAEDVPGGVAGSSSGSTNSLAPFHFAPSQVVETDGCRDTDQPTIQPLVVRQSALALEGASNRLLTQIVRIVAAAGHAVA